jgi:PAS domain S-box-containing protein
MALRLPHCPLKRLFGISTVREAICRLALVLGLFGIAFGGWRLTRPVAEPPMIGSAAKNSLDLLAQSLLADITRIVQPAITRTEMLAGDPRVRTALLGAHDSLPVEICNKAVLNSTDVDAVALFDQQGKILAINTKYASGQSIDPRRIERVLQQNFSDRPIIQQCVRGPGDERVLEFQTQCDITPALFDSTGLSVAYSAPVRESASGEKLGVVSSRLRFERLTDLIRSREVDGGIISIDFVTDEGDYFSEENNSGRLKQSIPRSELAAEIAPLVAGKAESVTLRRGGTFIRLYRLEKFATMTGRGIQVMIVADESWLAKEADQASKLAGVGSVACGLALLLLGGTIWGLASLRRSARSNAALASMVENSCDAVLGETRDGRINSWNQAAEQILGYSVAAALGRTVEFLLAPEQIEPFLRIRDQVQQGQPCPSFDTTFVHRDGHPVEVSLSVSPIKDEGGRVIGISKIVRDISHRKRMERELATRDEQLRQSHKLEAVGSLAGGIAHEFNNLLQVVRGYGEYAMEGLPHDEQRYQDLEQVLKAADRATTLTRQLLGFSRRQTLERVTFPHQEVVKDLVQLLRPIIGEHIELEITLDATAEPLHADRTLLQQMLLNLCINARDAMPDGGRLTIHTRQVAINQNYCDVHAGLKPGRYLTFSVADNGSGMLPDVKARIFEPFFTTKGVGRGTGLGLAMVYGCVQQHGGIINVYSEPGMGTTFRIYLPLAADATPVVSDAIAPKVRGGNETILVAEDEQLVRALTVRILKKAGYTVLEAADGLESVEVFRANASRISLVLLDAVMPKLTGLHAFERIKAARPDIPVVFCSGYDPEAGPVQSLVDHNRRLVQKPYDPDTLLRIVREEIDASLLAEDENSLFGEVLLEEVSA